MLEKWSIWSCFLVGFCMDYSSTLCSEKGAEVMKKWCIWSCFLIGFCIESLSTLGSERGAEVMEKWCIWSCFVIRFCAKLAQFPRARREAREPYSCNNKNNKKFGTKTAPEHRFPTTFSFRLRSRRRRPVRATNTHGATGGPGALLWGNLRRDLEPATERGDR